MMVGNHTLQTHWKWFILQEDFVWTQLQMAETDSLCGRHYPDIDTNSSFLLLCN